MKQTDGHPNSPMCSRLSRDKIEHKNTLVITGLLVEYVNTGCGVFKGGVQIYDKQLDMEKRPIILIITIYFIHYDYRLECFIKGFNSIFEWILPKKDPVRPSNWCIYVYFLSDPINPVLYDMGKQEKLSSLEPARDNFNMNQ